MKHWKWDGPVEGFPGFSASIADGKISLVCKDNFGRFCWSLITDVKVPKKKPSEYELKRLAGKAYSWYISGIQTSAL